MEYTRPKRLKLKDDEIYLIEEALELFRKQDIDKKLKRRANKIIRKLYMESLHSEAYKLTA